MSQQMIDDAVLDRLPLFHGLAPRARRALASRAVVRRFEPDEALWQAGAEPSGLLIVVEGEVRVVRSRGGRRHVIHVEGAGGTLGDVPFFESGRYPATAVASRRTTCIELDTEAIHAAIREDPALAFRLLARLAARVRHLVDRLDRLATLDVTQRLARFLLERECETGARAFTLGRPQREVAEELGTVREVVVRELRNLREAGLIRSVGRGRIEIVDPDGLRRTAGLE